MNILEDNVAKICQAFKFARQATHPFEIQRHTILLCDEEFCCGAQTRDFSCTQNSLQNVVFGKVLRTYSIYESYKL